MNALAKKETFSLYNTISDILPVYKTDTAKQSREKLEKKKKIQAIWHFHNNSVSFFFFFPGLPLHLWENFNKNTSVFLVQGGMKIN